METGGLFMGNSKSAFKHFLKKCISIAVIAICIIPLLFLLITGINSKFNNNYVAALPLKYNTLKNTAGPKIIIIGGSSAGYGINTNLLKEKTGYNVVNLGLHAGFGQLFNTELAKNYIGENDIVLLGYEYVLSKDVFEKLGNVELIMEGIDNHLEIYKEIPLKKMPEILGNLPHYSLEKLLKVRSENEITTGKYFDNKGNIIYPRDSCIGENGNYDNTKETEEKFKITPNNVKYLQELKTYIKDKNASVYFIAPPLMKEALEADEEVLKKYAETLELKTGIMYISDPTDYLFSSDCMYDTRYHCNDKGEIKRTELLAEDLKKITENQTGKQ